MKIPVIITWETYKTEGQTHEETLFITWLELFEQKKKKTSITEPIPCPYNPIDQPHLKGEEV